jgi:hypothetical protein
VFVEGDGDDIQVTTKKFSQFPTATGDGIQGVGIKDGNNVKFELTTDSIKVNPEPFRNAKGQFIGTPEELADIENQRDVNNFLYQAINDIEAGEIDLDGYATTDQLTEVDRTSQTRDEILDGKIDQESALNTAAHLKLENQILRIATWGEEDINKLQDQIDLIDEAMPDDPNNSNIVDIGEQTLKITGGRPTGPDAEDGKIMMWKATTGGPGNPYNECKFNCPDKNALIQNPDTVWWKQGDKVQVWYLNGDGWWTGGNLDVLHYSALTTSGDTFVDGEPIQLWYVDPKKAPAEYLDAISVNESKADDRKLQAEIDQVALALETLLVQREHGQWKYIGFSGDNIPRNAGEFSLISDDLSVNDNIITLNQEDLKGITHGFGDVEVGDYVEIVDLDEPENYALFAVTKAPEGSGIVNVEVSLKDKGQNILIGETCEIRFFQVNEQDLQLDDLDNRYLRLSGGEMAGSATLKVNVLEPVNTPMIQYNGDPDSTHAAGLINREMMRRYVAAELDKNPQTSQPMSGKLMVGFQLWGESRLAEGCFNLLDENLNPTSKIKSARFLTFHIIQDWDHVEWFKYDLRGKGQIHLTDLNGKYQMSKFVTGAEKHDAETGTDPTGALWFFELEEFGHDPDLTLSGEYFIEFDSCLKESS